MKKLLHLHNNATYYSVMKIKKKKNDNNEQYSYTVTKLSWKKQQENFASSQPDLAWWNLKFTRFRYYIQQRRK